MKDKSLFKDLAYVIIGMLAFCFVFMQGIIQFSHPIIDKIYYALGIFCLGQWLHLSSKYITLKGVTKRSKSCDEEKKEGNPYIFSFYQKVSLPSEGAYKQVGFILFNAVDGKYYHSPDNPLPYETEEEILKFFSENKYKELKGIAGVNNVYEEDKTLYMNSDGDVFIGTKDLMSKGLKLIANRCEDSVPADTFILEVGDNV